MATKEEDEAYAEMMGGTHLTEEQRLAKRQELIDSYKGPRSGSRRVKGGPARVILGAFLMLGWLVIWLVPGVLFNGSVSQVHSLCSVALFSNMSPASCKDASTATWVAWAMFGAGLISLIVGAVRWNRSIGARNGN